MEWLISQPDSPKLRTPKEDGIKFEGEILLIIQNGDLQARSLFQVLQCLAANVWRGAMDINKCIQQIFPMELQIVPRAFRTWKNSGSMSKVHSDHKSVTWHTNTGAKRTCYSLRCKRYHKPSQNRITTSLSSKWIWSYEKKKYRKPDRHEGSFLDEAYRIYVQTSHYGGSWPYFWEITWDSIRKSIILWVQEPAKGKMFPIRNEGGILTNDEIILHYSRSEVEQTPMNRHIKVSKGEHKGMPQNWQHNSKNTKFDTFCHYSCMPGLGLIPCRMVSLIGLESANTAFIYCQTNLD